MDQNKQWWIEKRCEKAAERLKSHEFDAIYVRTKEEAVREILKYVTPATKVGAGGSVTIRRQLPELGYRIDSTGLNFIRFCRAHDEVDS